MAGIVVICLVVWLFAKLSAGSPQLTGAPGASTTSTASSSTGASAPAAPTQTHPSGAASPAAAKITMTEPILGSQWILGEQNTIQWSRAAGSPDGTITLLDASTGVIVGWIQQHILTPQTNFSWDTGVVFPSRTSGLTKSVSTGNYRIMLTFNSPSIPSVTGPVFSIISPAEAQTPASSVTIQNESFSPSSITIKQGTVLTLINQDPRSYAFTVSSRAPSFSIGTSTSLVYDTSILSPGTYVFYSTAYPSLRLSITTQ